MRIYISGGITGVADARERFNSASFELSLLGYDPLNPFTVIPTPEQCDGSCVRYVSGPNPHDEEAVKNGGHSYACILDHDVKALFSCDGMALLPGWENSRGARMELQAAMSHENLIVVKSLDWWCGRHADYVRSMQKTS